MIDLHCHILPDMDDGPATLDEAVAMCRMAVADGIHAIVATPHYSLDSNAWTGRDLAEQIERLKIALTAERVDLDILPGAEIAIFPELVQALANGTVMTMNNKQRAILVEFPFDSAPPNWDAFLQNILDTGIVPIIAHPERNTWFIRHPEAIFTSVRRGCLTQITALSLLGGFGEEIREFSIFLLKHNLAHLIATDAHSVATRPPRLRDAVHAAGRVIGEERARELVTSAPQAIIEGRAVRTPEPEEHEEVKEAWFTKVLRTMARKM